MLFTRHGEADHLFNRHEEFRVPIFDFDAYSLLDYDQLDKPSPNTSIHQLGAYAFKCDHTRYPIVDHTQEDDLVYRLFGSNLLSRCITTPNQSVVCPRKYITVGDARYHYEEVEAHLSDSFIERYTSENGDNMFITYECGSHLPYNLSNNDGMFYRFYHPAFCSLLSPKDLISSSAVDCLATKLNAKFTLKFCQKSLVAAVYEPSGVYLPVVGSSMMSASYYSHSMNGISPMNMDSNLAPIELPEPSLSRLPAWLLSRRRGYGNYLREIGASGLKYSLSFTTGPLDTFLVYYLCQTNRIDHDEMELLEAVLVNRSISLLIHLPEVCAIPELRPDDGGKITTIPCQRTGIDLESIKTNLGHRLNFPLTDDEIYTNNLLHASTVMD